MAKKDTDQTTPESTPETTPTAAAAPDGAPKWQRMRSPESSGLEQGQPGPQPAPALATTSDPVQPVSTSPAQPEQTFTQAQLDAILKDRLERERKKFEDYNDLKKKATQFDEAEKAKLGEIDRLKLELDQATKAREEAQQVAERQAINNALLAKLSEFQTDKALGIRKDALGAALKLVDVSKVAYESGTVTGVEEAVKNLVEQHTFLLEQPRQTAAASPTNPARTTPQGTTDQERRARYFGGGAKTGFFQPKDENVVLPE